MTVEFEDRDLLEERYRDRGERRSGLILGALLYKGLPALSFNTFLQATPAPGNNRGLSHAIYGSLDSKMTLDVYADLFDDQLDAVAAKLDTAARAAAEVSRTDRGLNVLSMAEHRTRKGA